MTVSSSINKVIFNGDGVTTVWPFTFLVLEASHLSVIKTSAAGVETTLSASLYTVAGAAPWTAGSSVTYPLSGALLAVGEKLTILRTVPYTQSDRFSNQGGYYPEIIEGRFDKVYMALQQMEERLDRTSQYLVSDEATEQSNLVLIQDLQSYQGDVDKLITAGDVLTHNGVNYIRLARGTPGQYLGISGTALVWQTPTYTYSNIRQTVQHGPVTAAGLPNFLPSTNAALSITTQNVSAGYPLVASAANGSNASGPVNLIGFSTANIEWTGLTANRAAATPNFLYGVISAAGVITPASTILAPIYQHGGVPSTTSGQITFNISEMKAYLGNGVTAPQTNLVLFGEAATDGTGVISTVAYAYNARYDSGYTATLATGGVAVNKNHNIGVVPDAVRWIAECTTTDNGYAVGDQLDHTNVASNNGVVSSAHAIGRTRNALFMMTAGNPYNVCNKSTGATTALTLASWKYKFVATRGW